MIGTTVRARSAWRALALETGTGTKSSRCRLNWPHMLIDDSREMLKAKFMRRLGIVRPMHFRFMIAMSSRMHKPFGIENYRLAYIVLFLFFKKSRCALFPTETMGHKAATNGGGVWPRSRCLQSRILVISS